MRRSLYGVGQLGLTAFETFIRVYILLFYTDDVGLAPAWAGLALGLSVFWDALTDAPMGYFSDRWTWFGQRRRPYFLPGIIGAAICFGFLFSPPELVSQTSKFIYLLLFALGFNTFLTLVSVPYAALGADLSEDSSTRTGLYAWRLGFGNLGALLAVVLPTLWLTATQRFSYSAVSWLLGIIAFMSVVMTWAGTKEPNRKPTQSQLFSWREVRLVFQNKAFLLLFMSYGIATIGVAINSVFALYYYRHRLELSETMTQLILVVFLFCFTSSLVGWVLASKAFGKKICLITGISLLGLSGSIVYPLIPPGNFIIPFVYAIFGGLFIGSYVLLDAWLADVIDLDEWKSGQRRSGLYFGIWKWGEKTTRALSLWAGGLLLSAIGYSASAVEQTESVKQSLGWIFGPAVNLLFLIAALSVFINRFDDSKHRQLKRILDRK
jgi:GPH family glycoside/pentoside/hexuronide:cation symporter